MERKSAEMLSSFVTIIFSIFTIAIYIAYGGNIFSYALIAIAVLIALFNAWFISHEEKEILYKSKTKQRKPAKRKRKR